VYATVVVADAAAVLEKAGPVTESFDALLSAAVLGTAHSVVKNAVPEGDIEVAAPASACCTTGVAAQASNC
jgi:hypothetical protein